MDAMPTRELTDEPIEMLTELPEQFTPEQRAEREALLRSNPDQWDERSALEKLFDLVTRARITYYRPHAMPSLRRDIICLCCGNHYRPDDPMNAVNMYLCLSCILECQENGT